MAAFREARPRARRRDRQVGVTHHQGAIPTYGLGESLLVCSRTMQAALCVTATKAPYPLCRAPLAEPASRRSPRRLHFWSVAPGSYAFSGLVSSIQPRLVVFEYLIINETYRFQPRPSDIDDDLPITRISRLFCPFHTGTAKLHCVVFFHHGCPRAQFVAAKPSQCQKGYARYVSTECHTLWIRYCLYRVLREKPADLSRRAPGCPVSLPRRQPSCCDTNCGLLGCRLGVRLGHAALPPRKAPPPSGRLSAQTLHRLRLCGPERRLRAGSISPSIRRSEEHRLDWGGGFTDWFEGGTTRLTRRRRKSPMPSAAGSRVSALPNSPTRSRGRPSAIPRPK